MLVPGSQGAKKHRMTLRMLCFIVAIIVFTARDL